MPEDKGKTEGQQEPQEEWKVRFKDGTVFAPVTYENLLEWHKSGQIDDETPVAKNDLTAEWAPFKETEGFARAKAAEEGEQVFCTACGTPWPAGTKFCTKCGTNLETGKKTLAAGEKRPARVIKLRKKAKEVAAEQPEAEPPPQGGVQAPVAEEPAEAGLVEAPPAEEALEAAQVPPQPGMSEMPAAAAEAAEAPIPAKPRKRRKKKLIKLVVGAGVIAVALAIFAPEQMSDIVQKVKGLVGSKGSGSDEEQGVVVDWTGVSADVQSAIEDVRERISSELGTVPFADGQREAFATEVASFLKDAVEEFADANGFVSFATSLAEGDLRETASLLEEEKSLLQADSSTPRIDAMQGAIHVLLGREKKGMPLLAAALEEEDIARVAASLSRGAVEGCLDRLLLAQGKKDPWGNVNEILGMNEEALGDELLARHCGKALSALATVEALTGETSAEVPKRKGVRTKAFVSLFRRKDPAIQAAMVELGKTDPAKHGSVLNHPPVRVAYALKLMSQEGRAEPGADERLANALKEGLSADPDNAFYNYALASVYLRMKRDDEAIAEIAAGNKKPSYRDYSKERMAGLAKLLDSAVPYTAATMTISSPHLSTLASSSRRLLESAWSSFRIGRREEVFVMLGQWRKACERLRDGVCTFQDAFTVLNAGVPLMAAEAELYKRDGKPAEAWKVRRALVENRRLALAIEYGAQYGLSAEVFVKEVLAETEYEEEFSASSPPEVLARVWAKATERLDGILAQDPATATVPAQGANLTDRNYVTAKTSLDNRKYETAFQYANACLAQNPKHLWALKVMQEAVRSATAEADISQPKAVAYRLVRKRDLSLPGAKRLEYDIQEVAKGMTKEEAIATARSALQGFWKREKADAVRIYLTPQGSLLPYLRLTWAPGGDWEKAKEGTPYTEFEENLKVLE